MAYTASYTESMSKGIYFVISANLNLFWSPVLTCRKIDFLTKLTKILIAPQDFLINKFQVYLKAAGFAPFQTTFLVI